MPPSLFKPSPVTCQHSDWESFHHFLIYATNFQQDMLQDLTVCNHKQLQ